LKSIGKGILMGRTIVFDFDGTVMDTKIAYVNSIAKAFEGMQINITSEEISYTLFPSIRGTIERILAQNNRPEAYVAATVERRTIDILSNNWQNYVKVTQGMPELLEALNGNGFKMCIASNSHSSFVNPALSIFELEKYFCEILTLDTGTGDKSQSMKVLAKKLGLKPSELIYIGDTIMDIELATTLKCKLFLLLSPSSWDYPNKEQAINAAIGKSRVKICEDVEELEKQLL
jgi:phosphoglycolate phosphatase-like HAD superfamily hydrolase